MIGRCLHLAGHYYANETDAATQRLRLAERTVRDVERPRRLLAARSELTALGRAAVSAARSADVRTWAHRSHVAPETPAPI